VVAGVAGGAALVDGVDDEVGGGEGGEGDGVGHGMGLGLVVGDGFGGRIAWVGGEAKAAVGWVGWGQFAGGARELGSVLRYRITGA